MQCLQIRNKCPVAYKLIIIKKILQLKMSIVVSNNGNSFADNRNFTKYTL